MLGRKQISLALAFDHTCSFNLILAYSFPEEASAKRDLQQRKERKQK